MKKPVKRPRLTATDRDGNFEFTFAFSDIQKIIGKVVKTPCLCNGEGLLELKELAEALSALPQTPTSVKAVSTTAALPQKLLACSAQKELRLYATFCAVNILRICAPQTPFIDKELLDLFGCVVDVLHQHLGNPTSSQEEFDVCVNLLKCVEQVELYMLFLDLPSSNNQVTRLLLVLLTYEKRRNFHTVEDSALQVASGIISELNLSSQEHLALIVNERVVDTIFSVLLSSGPDPPTLRLAEAIIKKFEHALKPLFQSRLIQLLAKAAVFCHDSTAASLKQDLAEGSLSDTEYSEQPSLSIRFMQQPRQKLKLARQSLLTSLPDVLTVVLKLYHHYSGTISSILLSQITDLLSSDKDDVRSALVDFTVKLLSMAFTQVSPVGTQKLLTSSNSPTSDDGLMMMINSFMKRFKDSNHDIRIQMLEATVILAETTADSPVCQQVVEATQEKLLEATQERLLDVVDSVRAAAVKSLCHIMVSALSATVMSATAATSGGTLLQPSTSTVRYSLMEQSPMAAAAAGGASLHSFHPILKYWVQLGSASCNQHDEAGDVEPAAAVADLGNSESFLDTVCKRLRDKSLCVRVAAADGLIQVFRACCRAQYCSTQQSCSTQKQMMSVEETSVSLLCDRDRTTRALLVKDLYRLPHLLFHTLSLQPELSSTVFQTLLTQQGGLLPHGLKGNAYACIWADVFGTASPLEREELVSFLGSRALLQVALEKYASSQQRLAGMRSEMQDKQALLLNQARQRLTSLVKRCSWPGGPMGMAKAMEQLVKLEDIKDIKVFERLGMLCDPAAKNMNEAKVRAVRQDLMERLGSRTKLAEAVTVLLGNTQPLFLTGQHLLSFLHTALAVYGTSVVPNLYCSQDLTDPASLGCSLLPSSNSRALTKSTDDSCPQNHSTQALLLRRKDMAQNSRAFLKMLSIKAPLLLRPLIPHLVAQVISAAAASSSTSSATSLVDDLGGLLGLGDHHKQEQCNRGISRRHCSSHVAGCKGLPEGCSNEDDGATLAKTMGKQLSRKRKDVNDHIQSSSVHRSSKKCDGAAVDVVGNDVQRLLLSPGDEGANLNIVPSVHQSLGFVMQLLAQVVSGCSSILSRSSSQPLLPSSTTLLHLVDAVKQLSLLRGNIKVARWGPVLLKAVIPRCCSGAGGEAGDDNKLSSSSSTIVTHASGALSCLAVSAMSVLRPSAVADKETPAALQMICSVGEVAHSLFADHADNLTTYITENYMTAILPAGQYTRDCDDATVGQEGGYAVVDGSSSSSSSSGSSVSSGVVLKGRALTALARALSPSYEITVCAQAKSVVPPFVKFLDAVLDLEADLSGYGAESDDDRSHLRLSASKALLRLSWRHDRIIPIRVWVNLGLTMQDPLQHVRTAFLQKVSKHVAALDRRAAALAAFSNTSSAVYATLSSKYAAFLALSGLDPFQPNLEEARHALSAVILSRRHHAQQSLMSPGANVQLATSSRRSLSTLSDDRTLFSSCRPLQIKNITGRPTVNDDKKEAATTKCGNDMTNDMMEGCSNRPLAPILNFSSSNGAAGAALVQQPEFILPYLIYLLGHHPDMPQLAASGSRFVDVDTDCNTSSSHKEVLQSFSLMLQTVLQALLKVPLRLGSTDDGGDRGGPGKYVASNCLVKEDQIRDSLGMILKVLKSIKLMQDADQDCNATAEMLLLCDMGEKLACLVANEAHQEGFPSVSIHNHSTGRGGKVEEKMKMKQGTGNSRNKQGSENNKNKKQGAPSPTIAFSDSVKLKDYPGRIVLPQALYKSLAASADPNPA